MVLIVDEMACNLKPALQGRDRMEIPIQAAPRAAYASRLRYCWAFR
jgi:hypothetical protein